MADEQSGTLDRNNPYSSASQMFGTTATKTVPQQLGMASVPPSFNVGSQQQVTPSAPFQYGGSQSAAEPESFLKNWGPNDFVDNRINAQGNGIGRSWAVGGNVRPSENFRTISGGGPMQRWATAGGSISSSLEKPLGARSALGRPMFS